MTIAETKDLLDKCREKELKGKLIINLSGQDGVIVETQFTEDSVRKLLEMPKK